MDMVAFSIFSLNLFPTVSPNNMVNPTGLKTNKKFERNAETEAVIASFLVNNLNGFKDCLASKGITITLVSSRSISFFVFLLSKEKSDTINGPIVIPRKKEVVIVTF